MMEEYERDKSREQEFIQQAREWWAALLERLLKQDEVEDYYYEFRMEADAKTEKRYAVRMYPMWWAVYVGDWGMARRLWEKGYSLAYRREEELEGENLYDVRCLWSEDRRKQEGGSRWRASIVYWDFIGKRMVVDVVMRQHEHTEWIVSQLDFLRENLDEEETDDLLHGVRLEVSMLQDEQAYSERQEKWLDRLQERLPWYYHKLLSRRSIWYDLNSLKTRTSMGIPSFPLMKRYWEHFEMLEKGECGKAWEWKSRTQGTNTIGEDAENNRLVRWEQVLENTMERWLDELLIAVYRDGITTESRQTSKVPEYEALFERMHQFFLGYCKEAALKESYRKSIAGLLEQCRRLQKEREEGFGTERRGDFMRYEWLQKQEVGEYMKKWERRLEEELSKLEEG